MSNTTANRAEAAAGMSECWTEGLTIVHNTDGLSLKDQRGWQWWPYETTHNRDALWRAYHRCEGTWRF